MARRVVTDGNADLVEHEEIWTREHVAYLHLGAARTRQITQINRRPLETVNKRPESPSLIRRLGTAHARCILPVPGPQKRSSQSPRANRREVGRIVLRHSQSPELLDAVRLIVLKNGYKPLRP
jgi:hypothetical protein